MSRSNSHDLASVWNAKPFRCRLISPEIQSARLCRYRNEYVSPEIQALIFPADSNLSYAMTLLMLRSSDLTLLSSTTRVYEVDVKTYTRTLCRRRTRQKILMKLIINWSFEPFEVSQEIMTNDHTVQLKQTNKYMHLNVGYTYLLYCNYIYRPTRVCACI